jgi:hypothetical protein
MSAPTWEARMGLDRLVDGSVTLTRIAPGHPDFSDALNSLAEFILTREKSIGPSFRKKDYLNKTVAQVSEFFSGRFAVKEKAKDVKTLFLWQIEIDGTKAGYASLSLEGVNFCRLAFSPAKNRRTPEQIAEVMSGALPCLVEPFGFMFDNFPDAHWIFFFVNNTLIDDLSQALSQNGFDLEEQTLSDLVDRSVESLYYLARTTYGVYYRGEGETEE